MTLVQALVLGVVQGITEFVPISSSGHLVLLSTLFGISMPGLFFEVLLHGGTLLAVFVVFWKDILAILKKPFQPLSLYIILACIPAALAYFFFSDALEQAFSTGQLLGPSFLLTSVLLSLAELSYRRHGRGLYWSAASQRRNLNAFDALVVGLFQAIALLPGVSRSGATITGALSRRLDRELAARFSFLLSIPAILVALVVQIRELLTMEQSSFYGTSASLPWEYMIAGTAAAALVGFFAIRFMLKIIKERSLYGFALYTAILGSLILIDQFVTGIFF